MPLPSGRRAVVATFALVLLAATAAIADYIVVWTIDFTGYTRGMAVHADGRAFIGITNKSGSKTSLAAHDADGNELWSKAGPKNTEIDDVAVTPDGATVIAVGGTSKDELWIGTLGAAKGKKGWEDTFDLGLGLETYFLLSLAVAPDGECFFVGGAGFIDGVFSGFVAKFDIDGNLLWAELVVDPDGIEAVVTDVVADTRSDGVFFTGWFGNPESTTLADAIAGMFEGDGTEKWLKVSRDGEYERGQAIVLDPKGKNIYIAGDKGTDENGGGVLIMRVTPKGKIKWARRVDTDWFRSFAKDLVLDAKGKTLHIVGRVGPQGFGVGAGMMLMTNNKAKKPSWMINQPEGTEDTLTYEEIGRAGDGTYRIFGGRTDAAASLGSYTE